MPYYCSSMILIPFYHCFSSISEDLRYLLKSRMTIFVEMSLPFTLAFILQHSRSFSLRKVSTTIIESNQINEYLIENTV